MAYMVFHPFAPTVRPSDQVGTWTFLRRFESIGRVPVAHLPCLEPCDYAHWLDRWWSFAGDLVIVEHDVVPSLDALDGFVGCPQAFCAADYRLSSGELWSKVTDHDCLGLSCLKGSLRESVKARPAVPKVPYGDLAYELGRRLGVRAHLHPQVTHNHSLVAATEAL